MTAVPHPSPVPKRVCGRFRERFGRPERLCAFAPGRINLIGAHLDYSGGDVVPLAVDLGVYVALAPNQDGRVRVESLDQPGAVDIGVGELGERADPAHGWASYPLGVFKFFDAQAHSHARTHAGAGRGVDMVFGGDLPMASGMSSSAAIEIATAYALDQLFDSGLDPKAIADLAHRAETDYVHVKCGIMDQYASALGRSGHALLLHCRDGSYEHVEMHGSGFEILVMDTRKSRTLATSGFNQRVQECHEAHEILRHHVRDLPRLADYGPEDLERAGEHLNGVHARRARHVVLEMRRVAGAVAALRDGDERAFGAALTASHRSTSVDYEVSCAELDAITEAACAHPAVFGARLTGAGFGGCAIALVEPGRAAEVEAAVGKAFHARFGVVPGFMVLHAGGGPRRIR